MPITESTFMGAWLLALAPISALAVAGWLLGIARKNVGIVDSLWSLFFLLAVATSWYGSNDAHIRAVLVTVLAGLWAIRLSMHITRRNFGEAEDRRYRAIREKHEPGFAWKSLFIVFGPQALLAWIISLPLVLAVRVPAEPGFIDVLALLLWCVGFVFEAVGDWQLQRFLANPANRDRVLQDGLWRYTRHPNYFGEACMWWAFWLFALAAGGWWTVLSPILMTVLLLRVSGVTLLEKDISHRRPAYQAYVRRTNAFLPGPPRTGDA
jgi:steroid 5-alpha reductase family enzyme